MQELILLTTFLTLVKLVAVQTENWKQEASQWQLAKANSSSESCGAHHWPPTPHYPLTLLPLAPWPMQEKKRKALLNSFLSSQSLAVDTHFILGGSQLSLSPVLPVWIKLDQISIIWESKLWEFVFFCASPPFNFVTCFGQSGHVVGLVASSFPLLGLLLSASSALPLLLMVP